MKINEKILRGLSEAKTVDDSELWLKNLEKIIKKVNFNGLASVSGLSIPMVLKLGMMKEL